MNDVEFFSRYKAADKTGMKFLVVFSMGVLMVCLVVAQKYPVCLEKPRVDGQCPDEYRGYTYARGDGCERYHARGCKVSGNYFRTRNECQEKCSPSWQRGLEDFFIRSSNQFLLMVSKLVEQVSHMV